MRQIARQGVCQAGSAAIAGFWVAPALRGRGLGGYLLDRTLHDLEEYQRVEVQTHLVNHAKAVAIYEGRGFEVVDAWVNLSKECAVRGINPT
jgi:ribosomal protein S18 acetylase RimI-like enzyme